MQNFKKTSTVKARNKVKKKNGYHRHYLRIRRILEQFEPIAKLHREKFGTPFEENFKKLEQGSTFAKSMEDQGTSYFPRDHQLRAIREYMRGS